MRSRASTSLREARSHSAMANMPTEACNVASMPSAVKPASSVSVSEWPRQDGARPEASSCWRMSIWL